MTTTTNPSALDALLGATLDLTSEVYIARLKTAFTIRALGNDDLRKARDQATLPGPKGEKRVDDALFNAAVIAKGCTDPDFGNKALQAHYGASDALDCVGKALLPGEIQKVLNAILELSGFGDEDEAVADAKN